MNIAAMLWLWGAFAVGIGLRLSDRIEHAVKGSDQAVTTVGAYCRANLWRLGIRFAGNAVLFQAAVESGDVQTKIAALVFGYAVDTALDSILERTQRAKQESST